MVSYPIEYFSRWIIPCISKGEYVSIIEYTFFETISKEAVSPNFASIAIGATISVILSIFIVKWINSGLIYRLAFYLKISDLYDKQTVFYRTLGMNESQWVYVKDFEKDLIYFGWIENFSLPFEKEELLLREVDVYKLSDSTLLYKTPSLYISLNTGKYVIEFPLKNECI
jgi:hypothetical protein